MPVLGPLHRGRCDRRSGGARTGQTRGSCTVDDAIAATEALGPALRRGSCTVDGARIPAGGAERPRDLAPRARVASWTVHTIARPRRQRAAASPGLPRRKFSAIERDRADRRVPGRSRASAVTPAPPTPLTRAWLIAVSSAGNAIRDPKAAPRPVPVHHDRTSVRNAAKGGRCGGRAAARRSGGQAARAAPRHAREGTILIPSGSDDARPVGSAHARHPVSRTPRPSEPCPSCVGSVITCPGR